MAAGLRVAIFYDLPGILKKRGGSDLMKSNGEPGN